MGIFRKTMILTMVYAITMTAHAETKQWIQDQTINTSEVLETNNLTDSLTCQVSGIIVDHPETTQVMVIEAGEDFRVHPLRCYTTVADGKFSFAIRDVRPMAYDILFDDELKHGSWRTRQFFSGEGNVKLSYKNDEFYGDRIESDIQDNVLAQKFLDMEKELTQIEQIRLYAVMDSLYECKRAYSNEYQALIYKANSLPQGNERDSIVAMIQRINKGPREKLYSVEYMDNEYRLVKLFAQADSLKRSFISENPSVFGLHSIKESIPKSNPSQDWIDVPAYIDIFETIYKDRFPNHPYTAEIAGLIEALEIKEGNRYPDYKITREEGSTEQIASLIKGNVAVIDLWASWCGPCRRHSKELIPVYEKYKDKGFKVVAIAREDGDCEAMNEAMKKDGYPWESFVDLNDRDNVWRINRAGNAGGKIILVDADGKIVATDIPINEIEEYLKKTYGE